MKHKYLRVGVIGCGNIFHSHSLAYPEHPYIVLVGFYDRIRSRAEAWLEQMTRYMKLIKEMAEDDEEERFHLERYKIFIDEGKVYDNINDLISNVDIIDITAPNYVHAPYAIWALKQNKFVMSEKPPARCSYETALINRENEKSKGFYQLNENMLWQTYVRELSKIANNGKLGKINKVRVRLGHGGPSWGWNNHFMNPSLSGGGVLSDMGIHAIGIAYGIIGKNYKVDSIQALQLSSGNKPERTMRDSDGANKYSLHKFMVEDDALIHVWLKNQENNKIEFEIEVSWARTFQNIQVFGSDAFCELITNESKNKVIAIYSYDNEEEPKEILEIPPQGRDSHQLEIIDFLNRIMKKEKPYLDAEWAHQMQIIISGSYLSHLLSYQKGTKPGIKVKPEDLENFYMQFIKSGCPSELLIEEIVYRFMSPFTQGYFSPDEEIMETDPNFLLYEP